jgi:hypothetical protein
VEQRLVLRIAEAEVLQELVCQTHQLVHAHVLLRLKGDLQQIKDDGVHAHVVQEALLVLARPAARAIVIVVVVVVGAVRHG